MVYKLRISCVVILFFYVFECILINNIASPNFPIQEIRCFAYSYFIFWALFNIILYYKTLPPGPWGVPFLGYLPFMFCKAPHTLYLEMSAKYGDVFSIQLGSNLVVCLASTKLMKKFFNRPDSTGRPHTPLNKLMGGFGIIMSENNLWRRQRQFLHEKFRALGVKLCPNLQFEKYVIMEIEELLKQLEAGQGKPVSLQTLLGRHVHNVICQLMMSFRFLEDDEEFTVFNERVSRGMKLYGSVHIGEHVKHYLKLPGKKAVLEEMKRNLEEISQFHCDRIVERVHRRRGSGKGAEPADLLDHYLHKLEEGDMSGTKNDIFPDVQPEKQIVQVMNDLFSAGMETSLTTLLWTFLMMIREPGVLKKVRAELRKVVAPGHLVTLEHRLSLPYIEAVMYETMRMASIVPLGTTHVNTESWKIKNYIVPAGTQIIPLINKMNMEPEIYPEPKIFKPERFIKNGVFNTSDNFMQFGFGQRSCLGTNLARMELFLFFSNVINHYEFWMPEGEDPPGLDGILATTHSPLPYNLVFKKLDA